MERYTLNYQLFKRNNMKKYLSLVMIGLSLMLSGCNKDDNNDPDIHLQEIQEKYVMKLP